MKTDRLLHKFREQSLDFRGNLHETSQLHAGFRYQSAYQAAANVVTIVNDLLYTVVNMDVITT